MATAEFFKFGGILSAALSQHPDPQILGLIGLGFGGLLYFFTRKERPHNLGFAMLGLGLVFLGMYFMSKGVMPIRQNPSMQQAFARMSASSFGGFALVALVDLGEPRPALPSF